MPYILAGLLVFWLLLFAMRAFTKANPAALAQYLNVGGGGAALVFAALLLLRGRLDLAFAIGGVGLWLLAIAKKSPTRMFGFGGARRAGTTSRSVRLSSKWKSIIAPASFAGLSLPDPTKANRSTR